MPCPRAQESTSKEGSAVAKPRPMNLVSRNLLGAKKTRPQDSSASKSPGNQELAQSSVSWSARKLMRDNNPDPTAQGGHPNPKDKVGIPQDAKSPTIGTLEEFSRTCGKS